MKEGKNTEMVMQITIVTMLGEITFWARIRKGVPLYSLVEFESRRKYQSEIKAISVESLRMT